MVCHIDSIKLCLIETLSRHVVSPKMGTEYSTSEEIIPPGYPPGTHFVILLYERNVYSHAPDTIRIERERGLVTGQRASSSLLSGAD